MGTAAAHVEHGLEARYRHHLLEILGTEATAQVHDGRERAIANILHDHIRSVTYDAFVYTRGRSLALSYRHAVQKHAADLVANKVIVARARGQRSA